MFTITGNIATRYDYGRTKFKYRDSPFIVNRSRNKEFTFDLTIDHKKYMPSYYFLEKGETFFEYGDIDDIYNPFTSDVDDIFFKEGKLNVGFGGGFGKTRNVSPMIRALRFYERIKALGRDISLTDYEIQRLARHFTTYPGYSAVYDRPGKYFWSSLPKILRNKLNALSEFEMLYLTDVLQETVGERFLGSEVNAGAEITYTHMNFDGDEQNDFIAGVFVQGKVYHNPELEYQFSFTVDGNYGKYGQS